ncbi:MAG: hypothetical protein FWB85_04075 [Chitinispirillia bacterium]|nr:hypothetical protein [Chitinispirillia bacterium]MCL2241595.1 hypothetical protein [Chitinispirillia bacterium]
MKKITALLTVLPALILAITSTPAFADDSRSRGYGFLMLEEPAGPRSAAMGSAGTALGSGGFYYYNPAQPFFALSAFAAAEFGQMPGGVNRGGFETVLFSGEWFSAAGFHSSAVGYETRDEKGLGAEASSSTTIGAIGAGYIRNNLALAISAHMADDRIWAEEGDYRAFSFSAGLGYKLLDGKLNLGAAGFHGLAWSRGYGDSDSAKVWHNGKVPRFARAGAAWTDTLKSIPYTITADAVYRDENGTFTLPVGLEVSILPSVNLRAGKRIGWDNEVMSLGIGFNIDRLTFDAAFIPTVFVSDYEMKWSMGFTYRIGPIRKKGIVMEPFRIKPEDPAPEEPSAVPVPEEPVSEPVLVDGKGDSVSTEEENVSTEPEPAEPKTGLAEPQKEIHESELQESEQSGSPADSESQLPGH